jgi:segregation and condensation protein A
MSFEVSLEQFDGPLHLLLDLIESQELPVTDVSLSLVTEAYLNHVNSTEVPPAELADFLVVATKLLLIKSRAILPIPEEDEKEDPSTLALQLRLYKEFVEASRKLEAMWDGPERSFARSQADIVKAEGFTLSPGLDTSVLQNAFRRLMAQLEPFFRIQQAAMERVVSVKERLHEIHDAILARSQMTFKQVIGKGTSKVDVVVSFLALLELVKQRIVNTVQSDSFQDIQIKRVD